jgi:hypothetical protein
VVKAVEEAVVHTPPAVLVVHILVVAVEVLRVAAAADHVLRVVVHHLRVAGK